MFIVKNLAKNESKTLGGFFEGMTEKAWQEGLDRKDLTGKL